MPEPALPHPAVQHHTLAGRELLFALPPENAPWMKSRGMGRVCRRLDVGG